MTDLVERENKMNKIDERIEQFRWLDIVRKSGTINMFGARPHLAKMFNLSEEESSAIHTEWMASFSEYETVEDRATKSLEGKWS